MRNPIRLKNLKARFLPFYMLGIAMLVFQPPRAECMLTALPLIFAGAALRAWGAGHLVKNDRLTTTGPYAHVRHPLYLGTILVSTGFAIWVGGWLAVGLLTFVWPWFALGYFPRKERSESARLEATYGDRFVRYRGAVPALWPRLWGWRDDRDSGGSSRWAFERYADNNELGTMLALAFGAIVFWLRGAGSPR